MVVKGSFDAAHRLPGVDICQQTHGHTFLVEVTLEGKQLDDKKMLVDFRKVKQAWKKYDHKDLNDFFPMPTAEILALVIFNELQTTLPVKVKSVKVWESPDCIAEYYED